MSSLSLSRASLRSWLIPAIVLLGLSLRAWHYFLCPAVWHDEAALVMNVLRLDFRQLLGPLLWHEAAPPLFLWMERAMYLTLGDHIQVLRLLPFLASCASLILLVPVARSLLPAGAVPWALLLFACGDKLAWHACEAKPYAIDVLAAVLLLRVFCAGRLSLLTRLILFTLLAPLLILVSYPACFLFGGVLLALLLEVWRDGRWGTWAAYVGLMLAVGASFLLLLGPGRAQKDGAMMSCWLGFFPDWSRPWTIPGWVATSTAEMFRYCLPPLGQVLTLFAVVGTVVLWRSGQRGTLYLLLVPGLLVLFASLTHNYPYGGGRVIVFLAPAVALLVAAGVPPILAWLRQRGRLAVGVALLLLLLPLTESLQRLASPWRRADTAAASAWVLDQRLASDLVLGNDWAHAYYFRHLGECFRPLQEGDPIRPIRAWVVYTGRIPAVSRLEQARGHAPPGWAVMDHREFLDTTVLLLAAPVAIQSVARNRE